MKASTIILAFALIVAVTNAAGNATVGTNCTANHAICSATSAQLCCANLVRVVNSSLTNSTQVCLNQSSAAAVSYNTTAINGTGSCIVPASNNSFLVKLSVAVASLGFLSLLF